MQSMNMRPFKSTNRKSTQFIQQLYRTVNTLHYYIHCVINSVQMYNTQHRPTNLYQQQASNVHPACSLQYCTFSFHFPGSTLALGGSPCQSELSGTAALRFSYRPDVLSVSKPTVSEPQSIHCNYLLLLKYGRITSVTSRTTCSKQQITTDYNRHELTAATTNMVAAVRNSCIIVSERVVLE